MKIFHGSEYVQRSVATMSSYRGRLSRSCRRRSKLEVNWCTARAVDLTRVEEAEEAWQKQHTCNNHIYIYKIIFKIKNIYINIYIYYIYIYTNSKLLGKY